MPNHPHPPKAPRPDDDDQSPSPPAYEVGYGRPPVHTRFKAGQSGNPRGRRRKPRALVSTKIGGQPGIGFEDRVKSLALEEAYRPITVREGDRVERIPLIQAILRKLGVAAVKGNTRAQRDYLNLVSGAEAARGETTMELLKTAIEYKDEWGRVLAARARDGTTGPEPVPHPDDIIIDFDNGEVRIDGPASEVQKAAWDKLRAMRPQLERNLIEISKQIEAEPSNSVLRERQKRWKMMKRLLEVDDLRRARRSARQSV
jgi:hypothetical protein